MDDFETFKASREKMDPSTRKFSKRQWQKSYSAYRSARERVNEKRPKSKSGSSTRRRPSKRRSSAYSAASHGPVMSLRSEVRHNSAYSEVRMMVDLLAWIAIGLFVLAGVVKLLYYTDPWAALGAILQAASMVIAVVVLRLLAHVIIDIPDIALRNGPSREDYERREVEGE